MSGGATGKPTRTVHSAGTNALTRASRGPSNAGSSSPVVKKADSKKPVRKPSATSRKLDLEVIDGGVTRVVDFRPLVPTPTAAAATPTLTATAAAAGAGGTTAEELYPDDFESDDSDAGGGRTTRQSGCFSLGCF